VRERSNADWLTALHGTPDDEALLDLRHLLVRGLGFALADRLGADPEATVEDFAQESLLKILRSLDTFRGESQFTTWAQKIAVRVALTELRRRRWQDVSLEDVRPLGMEADPIELPDPAPLPEQQVMQAALLDMVQRMMMEQLTDRQRQAMLAVMVKGMPLEEVARRLGTNRNALYKLLHDARQRMQQRLRAQGLSVQDLLATLADE
jgi:RNA polymerase sigma-70 factor (ECF subfamily)